MAKRIEKDIVINKKPHEIYFFISNLLNLPLWSDVATVEIVSGNGEVGTIYNVVTPTLLDKRKTPIEITQKSANELFAFKNNSYVFDNETGFSLKEEDLPAGGQGGQTRVTAYQEIGLGAITSLLTLNFLTSKDAAHSLSEMLEKLKSTLES